jgi:hypothetical protein
LTALASTLILGDARHIKGIPWKEILVHMENVVERAFLFVRQHGPDLHHLI